MDEGDREVVVDNEDSLDLYSEALSLHETKSPKHDPRQLLEELQKIKRMLESEQREREKFQLDLQKRDDDLKRKNEENHILRKNIYNLYHTAKRKLNEHETRVEVLEQLRKVKLQEELDASLKKLKHDGMDYDESGSAVYSRGVAVPTHIGDCGRLGLNLVGKSAETRISDSFMPSAVPVLRGNDVGSSLNLNNERISEKISNISTESQRIANDTFTYPLHSASVGSVIPELTLLDPRQKLVNPRHVSADPQPRLLDPRLRFTNTQRKVSDLACNSQIIGSADKLKPPQPLADGNLDDDHLPVDTGKLPDKTKPQTCSRVAISSSITSADSEKVNELPHLPVSLICNSFTPLIRWAPFSKLQDLAVPSIDGDPRSNRTTTKPPPLRSVTVTIPFVKLYDHGATAPKPLNIFELPAAKPPMILNLCCEPLSRPSDVKTLLKVLHSDSGQSANVRSTPPLKHGHFTPLTKSGIGKRDKKRISLSNYLTRSKNYTESPLRNGPQRVLLNSTNSVMDAVTPVGVGEGVLSRLTTRGNSDDDHKENKMGKVFPSDPSIVVDELVVSKAAIRDSTSTYDVFQHRNTASFKRMDILDMQQEKMSIGPVGDDLMRDVCSNEIKLGPILPEQQKSFTNQSALSTPHSEADQEHNKLQSSGGPTHLAVNFSLNMRQGVVKRRKLAAGGKFGSRPITVEDGRVSAERECGGPQTTVVQGTTAPELALRSQQTDDCLNNVVTESIPRTRQSKCSRQKVATERSGTQRRKLELSSRQDKVPQIAVSIERESGDQQDKGKVSIERESGDRQDKGKVSIKRESGDRQDKGKDSIDKKSGDRQDKGTVSIERKSADRQVKGKVSVERKSGNRQDKSTVSIEIKSGDRQVKGEVCIERKLGDRQDKGKVSIERESGDRQDKGKVSIMRESGDRQDKGKVSIERELGDRQDKGKVSIERESGDRQDKGKVSVERTSGDRQDKGEVSVERTSGDRQDKGKVSIERKSGDRQDKGKVSIERKSGDRQDKGKVSIERKSGDRLDKGEVSIERKSGDRQDKGKVSVERTSGDRQDKGKVSIERKSGDRQDKGKVSIERKSGDRLHKGEVSIGRESGDRQDKGKVSIERELGDRQDKGKVSIERESGDRQDKGKVSVERTSGDRQDKGKVSVERKSGDRKDKGKVSIERESGDRQDKGEVSVERKSGDRQDKGKVSVERTSGDRQDKGKVSIERKSGDRQDKGKVSIERKSGDRLHKGEVSIGRESGDRQDKGKVSIERELGDRQDKGKVSIERESGDRQDKGKVSVERTSGDRQDKGKVSVERKSGDRKDKGKVSIERESGDRQDKGEVSVERKSGDRQDEGKVSIERKSGDRQDKGKVSIERKSGDRQDKGEVSVERKSGDRQDEGKVSIERKSGDRQDKGEVSIERESGDRQDKGEVSVERKSGDRKDKGNVSIERKSGDRQDKGKVSMERKSGDRQDKDELCAFTTNYDSKVQKDEVDLQRLSSDNVLVSRQNKNMKSIDVTTECALSPRSCLVDTKCPTGESNSRAKQHSGEKSSPIPTFASTSQRDRVERTRLVAKREYGSQVIMPEIKMDSTECESRSRRQTVREKRSVAVSCRPLTGTKPKGGSSKDEAGRVSLNTSLPDTTSDRRLPVISEPVGRCDKHKGKFLARMKPAVLDGSKADGVIKERPSLLEREEAKHSLGNNVEPSELPATSFEGANASDSTSSVDKTSSKLSFTNQVGHFPTDANEQNIPRLCSRVETTKASFDRKGTSRTLARWQRRKDDGCLITPNVVSKMRHLGKLSDIDDSFSGSPCRTKVSNSDEMADKLSRSGPCDQLKLRANDSVVAVNAVKYGLNKKKTAADSSSKRRKMTTLAVPNQSGRSDADEVGRAHGNFPLKVSGASTELLSKGSDPSNAPSGHPSSENILAFVKTTQKGTLDVAGNVVSEKQGLIVGASGKESEDNVIVTKTEKNQRLLKKSRGFNEFDSAVVSLKTIDDLDHHRGENIEAAISDDHKTDETLDRLDTNYGTDNAIVSIDDRNGTECSAVRFGSFERSPAPERQCRAVHTDRLVNITLKSRSCRVTDSSLETVGMLPSKPGRSKHRGRGGRDSSTRKKKLKLDDTSPRMGKCEKHFAERFRVKKLFQNEVSSSVTSHESEDEFSTSGPANERHFTKEQIGKSSRLLTERGNLPIPDHGDACDGQLQVGKSMTSHVNECASRDSRLGIWDKSVGSVDGSHLRGRRDCRANLGEPVVNSRDRTSDPSTLLSRTPLKYVKNRPRSQLSTPHVLALTSYSDVGDHRSGSLTLTNSCPRQREDAYSLISDESNQSDIDSFQVVLQNRLKWADRHSETGTLKPAVVSINNDTDLLPHKRAGSKRAFVVASNKASDPSPVGDSIHEFEEQLNRIDDCSFEVDDDRATVSTKTGSVNEALHCAHNLRRATPSSRKSSWSISSLSPSIASFNYSPALSPFDNANLPPTPSVVGRASDLCDPLLRNLKAQNHRSFPFDEYGQRSWDGTDDPSTDGRTPSSQCTLSMTPTFNPDSISTPYDESEAMSMIGQSLLPVILSVSKMLREHVSLFKDILSGLTYDEHCQLSKILNLDEANSGNILIDLSDNIAMQSLIDKLSTCLIPVQKAKKSLFVEEDPVELATIDEDRYKAGEGAPFTGKLSVYTRQQVEQFNVEMDDDSQCSNITLNAEDANCH